MSNLKDLFQEIKEVFNSEGVETEVTETLKHKFEDVVLADGTLAQVEPSVEVGAAVVVQSEDELITAPDGKHELSDGRTIVVEGGVIIEIMETEDEMAEEKEVTEEVMNEKEITEEVMAEDDPNRYVTVEDWRGMEERVANLEDAIADLKRDKVSMSEEIEEFKTKELKDNETFNKVVELLEIMVSEPKQESIKKTYSGFHKVKIDKTDIVEKVKRARLKK